MNKRTDTEVAQLLLNQLQHNYDSKVKAAQANPVDEIKTIVLDLSNEVTRESPKKISFPFKNMRVEEASDLDTFIRLIPESEDMGRGDILLGLRDDFNSEYGFSKCFLYWKAQPGKKVVLKFFTTSKVTSGRLVLDQQGLAETSLGFATAPMDGLTIKLFNDDINISSTRAFPMRSMNPPSLNVGTMNFGAANLGDLFVVPLGYTAEILGIELEIYQAPASGGDTMAVYATKEGTNYPLNVYDYQDGIASLGNITTTTPIGKYKYHVNSRPLQTPNKSIERDGSYADEGEMIAIAPNAFPILGKYGAMVMIRLKNKLSGGV